MVEIIKRLCNARGKTISALEKECNLGSGSIGKWDKNSPSVMKVVTVAKALGVPVSYLIEDDIFEGPSPQFIRRTELLKRRDISFNELSKKTGISVYRLKHYFLEDTLGEIDFFREYPRLARALGVSPQYLHCLTDQEDDEADTDARFCDWVVGNSEINEYFPNQGIDCGQTEKPVPMDRDRLNETQRKIMECVGQMSEREQEAFLAWLQVSQERS